jgi:hypothetical protein
LRDTLGGVIDFMTRFAIATGRRTSRPRPISIAVRIDLFIDPGFVSSGAIEFRKRTDVGLADPDHSY